MTTLDPLSVAHEGNTRAAPPATGAEPQRDALLRAHEGFLALIVGDELTDDEVFCVVLRDDDDFAITLTDDEVFCVVLEDDDDFAITLTDDEVFCVVLEDDDEVEL